LFINCSFFLKQQQLIKTFKFCHDPSDVYNFLGDSHVLVELIQLGRADKNEVLAWFETNAKDFLYHSTSDFKSNYHSPQRDVFMVRGEGFPVSRKLMLVFLVFVMQQNDKNIKYTSISLRNSCDLYPDSVTGLICCS
jgi:hypothetical protein